MPLLRSTERSERVLADSDLTNIYAFLQSRLKAAAVDSIPLLK